MVREKLAAAAHARAVSRLAPGSVSFREPTLELIQETSVNCPYCDESIDVLLDGSVEDQQYIEDCQVCCCPIVFHVRITASGRCTVEVRDENET